MIAYIIIEKYIKKYGYLLREDEKKNKNNLSSYEH